MERKWMLVLLLLFLWGMQGMVAQQTRVTGTVISEEDGEPVIGASVVVKGTSTGTVTNYDGGFSLDAPSGATLQVSYIGMKMQEVKAGTGLQVVMTADLQTLDEVIVVAYGTAKKSSFTGSATSVNSQSIEKRALANVASVLEGNVSGLQVTSGYGQPGASPSFRIRGFGSINSSSTPLMVLDGAIFDGSLADLNPNDIESMTVLKDAASTSLYGSSAGNGVILITTKQGKGDGSAHNVSLNISQGFSQRGIPEYDRIGVWDYYPVQWEMLRNTYRFSSEQDAATAAENATKGIYNQLKYNPFKGIANDAIVGTDGKLNPAATQLLWGDDLDWDKESYRTGHFQDYNLSYSSKTDKSDAFASVSYQDNEGYALKTDMKRFTGRVNYNIYPVKWFKTGLNIGASRTESNNANSDNDSSSSYGNIFRFTRRMAPIYPVYKHDPETGEYLLADGERIYDYDGNRISDTGRHVIAETVWNERLAQRDQFSARTYLEFALYDGLKLNVNANLENRNLRNKTYENTKVGDGSPAGRMSISQNRYTIYQFNQLLTYVNSFGFHNIDILAGHENYSFQRQYMYGMRQGEILSGLHEFGNFVTINTLSSYTDNYTKEGFLFRGNYNYNDRYYGSFSYRRDGSSRFYKDTRWGDFWSFGASWRIDQEKFIQGIPWINSLKLRASYGETGNDDLGTYYAYQTLYSNGINNRDEAGIYFDSFGNRELKWETAVSSDVAVEFGLFDRLTGSVEYYRRNSRDLLFEVPMPLSAGVASIDDNIGRIDNYGVEINLDYVVFKNNDWRVSAGANASTVKNVIKSLPQEDQTIISGTKRYEVGRSRYDYWLRQYVGVDPGNGAALYLFDEENQSTGDDVFERDGRQLTTTLSKALYDYSGSSIPKLYGGFNASAQYKGFELSGVLSWQLGGKMLDSGYQDLMTNRYGYSLHTDALKAWKQEGDVTDVPRLDQSKTTDFDGTSSRFLISSDFLNIRNITLSYALPKSILRPAGFKTTRLSVSGENLHQFNARKGLNAMAEFSGSVYNVYLPARTVTATLNLSF